MGRIRPSRARAGIALIAVLWVLVLLSAIAASFVIEIRTETELARNAVEAAKARALADAGVYRVLVAMIEVQRGTLPEGEVDLMAEGFEEEGVGAQNRPREFGPRGIDEPEARAEPDEDPGPEAAGAPDEGVFSVAGDTVFPLDGTPFLWRFAGGEVVVSARDEAGRMDLNRAPEDQLKWLFIAAGLDEAEAAALADAVADFRDGDDLRRPFGAENRDYAAAGMEWGAKDAPFDTVSELTQVLGMTQPLYETVAGSLTVFAGTGKVKLGGSTPLVLEAMTRKGSAEFVASGRYPGTVDLPDAESPEEEAPEAPAAAPETTLGDAEDEAAGPAPTRARVARIRAEARTPAGGVFVREAVVRFTRSAGRPYLILAWEQGRLEEPAPAAPAR